MDKESFLKNIRDKEEKMFFSSVYDKLLLGNKRDVPVFCDFLSEEKLARIMPVMEYFGASPVSNIINAQRKMPALNFQYTMPKSDILFIDGINADTVSHRDVLGSLMSLGISRHKVGDIIIKEKAFVEIKSEITPYVLQSLTKIRNRNVKAEIFSGEVKREFDFESLSLIVSSLRADRIVGAIMNLSGDNAKELVLSGRLIVNSRIFENPSKPLKEGDTLSVRGSGKYVFSEISGETKKGRTKIIIKKYI